MPGSQLKEKMFKCLGQGHKNKENRETHTNSSVNYQYINRLKFIHCKTVLFPFARRDVKDNFYHARKQLKDLTTLDLGYSEKHKIYLAESLTERNRMPFKDCFSFVAYKNESAGP